MKFTPARVGWMGMVVGWLSTTAAAQPGFFMRIVAVNGTPVTPRTSMSIEPRDEITVEIFATQWSPSGQQLAGYQIGIDSESLVAGDVSGGFRGDLRVKRGARPCTTTRCTNVGLPANCQCQDLQTVTGGSQCVGGFCTDPLEEAPFAAGLFIDPTHGARPDEEPPVPPDFALSGLNAFLAVDEQANFPFLPIPRLSAVSFGGAGPTFDGTPKYAGTMILVASADSRTTDSVCGSFGVKFLPSEAPEGSSMTAVGLCPICQGSTRSAPPCDTPDPCVMQLNGVTLNATPVDECPCTRIASATPRNCTVDARQDVDPETGEGFSRLQEVTFEMNCENTEPLVLDVTSFRTKCVPPTLIGCPTIFSRMADGPNITLELNTPIPLKERWVCIEFASAAEQQERCYAVLPGDADAGALVLGDDVQRVIDCVRGDAPAEECQLFNCDADRSGACRAGDVPRIVDLVVERFNQFVGTSAQVTCPSAGE